MLQRGISHVPGLGLPCLIDTILEPKPPGAMRAAFMVRFSMKHSESGAKAGRGSFLPALEFLHRSMERWSTLSDDLATDLEVTHRGGLPASRRPDGPGPSGGKSGAGAQAWR